LEPIPDPPGSDVSDAAYRPADRRRARVAWAASAAALLGLLLWSRRPETLWLTASAAASLAALVLAWRHPARSVRRALLSGLGLLAAGLAAGTVTQGRLSRIEADWPSVQAGRVRSLAERIGREVGSLADRGLAAAAQAAAVAVTDSALPSALAAVLDRTGVDAVMVFGANGDLIGWAGEHRGQIPRVVSAGEGPPAWFEERPLYSYLYFATPVKAGGRRAVAAVLLETAAPREGAARTVSMAARTDLPALFRSGGASGDDVAWSLVVDGDTVVHARVDAPSQGDARQETGTGGARVVFALSVLAFLILLAGWLQEPGGLRPGRIRAAPLLVAAAGLALAPLGRILGSPRAFSPFEFLLPGPRPVPLGVLFAVFLPLAALAATLVRGPRREREGDAALALGLSVAAMATILVAALRVLQYSTAASLLRGGGTLWFGLQTTGVLLLASATALLLPGPVTRARGQPVGVRRSWAMFAGALLAAALLGIAAHAQLEAVRDMVPAMAVAWALPYALLGIAFRDTRVSRSGLARWLAAGFVAACAVLPQLWGGHIGARVKAATEDINSLGAETPPILDYLLLEFAREAAARHARGETGAQLVYRSWVASGLAREPYPVRVTLWTSRGAIETELGLGGARGQAASREAMRQHVLGTLDATRGDTVPRTGALTGVPDVSRILTAALDEQHVLSATVEPRRSLRRTGILAPFLGGGADPDAELSLVRARSGDLEPAEPSWSRVPGGWRGEALVRYPDGPFNAHLTLRVTPFWMQLARAALLVAFDLALLAMLWVAGHLAQGIRLLPGQGMPWVHTFRARITLALFVFFLVPTAVFGWIAYRGLSAVLIQAATATASRAAQQAALEWPRVEGDLGELASHAGADVLYYFRGELAQVSSPEALALGIYNAWMRPETFHAFEAGEETAALESGRIGDQDYVTAFHVLQPAGTLAVPMGITAGETAQRQRDVAHLVLLAVVLGGALSMLLSIMVGRTLAGPIGLLQRAAAAVGGGRLSVKLPEPKSDEFGQLFSSFNRMVRQLRRARAREVRTARVLAWGEMARQIAHEIKNPLTPIRLAVQHLRRAYRDGHGDFGELLDENVSQVLTEIDRLNSISRAFSRYGAPRAEAGPLGLVDPAGVVREALTLYRAGESGIEYLDRLDSALPPVRARPDEVREVLLNLLENARDAVGDEGRVTVSGRREDGFVEIEVRDTGPGIAGEMLPRIFEPHFSTRSSGTGLGLAIVRRLVEGWGGTVEADSTPGVGTALRFRIPTAEFEGEEPGPGPGSGPVPPGAEGEGPAPDGSEG
jgi:signal transduction histidine kinase